MLTSVQTVGEQFAWQSRALDCQALLINQFLKSSSLILNVFKSFFPETLWSYIYSMFLEQSLGFLWSSCRENINICRYKRSSFLSISLKQGKWQQISKGVGITVKGRMIEMWNARPFYSKIRRNGNRISELVFQCSNIFSCNLLNSWSFAYFFMSLYLKECKVRLSSNCCIKVVQVFYKNGLLFIIRDFIQNVVK